MKKTKIIIAVVAVLVVAVIAAVAVPLLMEEKVPEGMVKVWLVESAETKNGVGYTYEYDEQGNLTAEIKSNSYKFSYDKNGKLIQEAYFTFIDNIQQQIDYVYDDSGRLVKEIYTYDDGRSWESEYFYDENGLKLKATSTNPNADGVTFFEYDSEGRLILSRLEDGSEWKTEYTYDDKGNLIKQTDFSDGKEVYRNEYKYDEKNRVIEKNSIHVTDYYDCYIYGYDEADRIISEKKYSCSVGEEAVGEPYYQIVNKYDEKGLKLSMEETDSYDTYVTDFIYNKEGRLTKIKHTDSALGNSKCKYTSVIVTPEQAEKIKTSQKMIYDELVYDDVIIIEQ